MTEQRPAVEYYFSFISLWSYIGSLVFQDIVKRHDIRVEFKPIDLLAVFAAGGGKPVRERPPQWQAYRLIEMARWKDIRGIPLVTWPKFYPADPTLGHRLLLAAVREGRDVTAFAHAGLRAVWADELNVEDPATLVHLADANGLNGKDLLAQANHPVLAHARGHRPATIRRTVLRSSRRAVLGAGPSRPSGTGHRFQAAADSSLEHDPEKWKPVFRKDHAQTINWGGMTIRR